MSMKQILSHLTACRQYLLAAIAAVALGQTAKADVINVPTVDNAALDLSQATYTGQSKQDGEFIGNNNNWATTTFDLYNTEAIAYNIRFDAASTQDSAYVVLTITDVDTEVEEHRDTIYFENTGTWSTLKEGGYVSTTQQLTTGAKTFLMQFRATHGFWTANLAHIVFDPVFTPRAALSFDLQNLVTLMQNYRFSDQLPMLQAVYDRSQQLLASDATTDEEFTAQRAAIVATKQQFMETINYTEASGMTQFYSWSGMALGLGTSDVTIGDYTGRPLTFTTTENAQDFLLTKNGTVDGLQAYSVKTASGTMVQATDGTLLFVPASQLANTSSAAQMVMCNRRSADEPGFDLKVGDYYYYYDEDNAELTYAEGIPTVESFDELAGYLFFPQAATEYNRDDHDAVNYAMTAGEGSLFEFNGDVEKKLEPAYAYSLSTYDWDATLRNVAQERATLPYFEGWSTNGWRMATDIVAATLETGEKCMRLNVKDTYDDIHADSISVAERTVDWSNLQSVSIMREDGRYTSATNRVPVQQRADGSWEQQVPDSTYAINMNSGINRYFAVKWKSTNPEVTFGGLTFYVRKYVEEPNASIENLLEKRGDVYVWDLVACGIPYGDRKACAQYLSWNGLTKSTDYVYVDWMRFYENLEDIPTESLSSIKQDETAISTISADSQTDGRIYDLQGRRVAQPAKGLYIQNGRKIVLK